MLLEPGEKFVPEEYENLPCCLSLLIKRKSIIALNKEKPDFSLIKGNSSTNNGAANNILPAKINNIPKIKENNTIKILTFLEIFCVLALANQDNINTKIIKIIIPKKTKFIY